MRAIVGVEGLAGHALPALALARAMAERGHEVRFASHSRWREAAEELGVGFMGGDGAIAPGVAPGAPIAATVRALLPGIDHFRPDVIVGDALSAAPTIAAEAAGVPAATLYPEVYPYSGPGLPPFALGLMPARTPIGRAAWRALGPVAEARLPATAWRRESRDDLNAQRAELGLPPVHYAHGPVGPGPELVATLPELEYPRAWPAGVHVTGPMGVDLPQPGGLVLPAGTEPLVLVAPSTVKDPERRLVAAALEALADEPVRVVASTSGAAPPAASPANAVVAEWIDYAEVMPRAALVVSNGTHGTIVKALGAGVPLAIAPTMPDDLEHGIRVAWAGAGLTTPARPVSPGALRSVVRRVLADPRYRERAREIAAANAGRDGAGRGAELVEACAR